MLRRGCSRQSSRLLPRNCWRQPWGGACWSYRSLPCRKGRRQVGRRHHNCLRTSAVLVRQEAWQLEWNPWGGQQFDSLPEFLVVLGTYLASRLGISVYGFG